MVSKMGGLNTQNKAATEKVRSEDIRACADGLPTKGRKFPGSARWTIAKGQAMLDDFELAS
jgi:hypothetical protein